MDKQCDGGGALEEHGGGTTEKHVTLLRKVVSVSILRRSFSDEAYENRFS